MTSKRLAKSMVDWAKFGELVPANQTESFRALKAKSDVFVASVHKYPAELPKIDFAQYRSRLASPALVDQFEKAYQNVAVPFPKDNTNLKAEVDASEQQAQTQSKAFVAEMQKQIEDSKAFLANVNLVPAYPELSHQIYTEFFPDMARDPVKRPTFFPHKKMDQPENDPRCIN